jgi:hypothetical protein
MRRLVATAVALAPLMAAAGAHAEVVISTARTTPIVTSTATGTAADNIRFASGGSIAVNTGVLVTVDSNNSIDLDSGSSLTMANSANGSTAILVGPGATTANITIGGSITVTDDIETYPDTDSDGDMDGPLANGSDRFGLRLVGGTPLTGNILIENSASIIAEGTNSRAVSIERALTGNVTSFGTLRAVGDNAVAYSQTGNVSGSVLISGPTTAQGLNANAVNIQGDVGGRLTLQSDTAVTGYRYTTRPSDAAIAKLEADDLLQGGSAVVIAGNVGGGVVLDIRPVDLITDDANNSASTDEDGDGIPDAQESDSVIESYGGAAALTVGSATRGITLGAMTTSMAGASSLASQADRPSPSRAACATKARSPLSAATAVRPRCPSARASPLLVSTTPERSPPASPAACPTPTRPPSTSRPGPTCPPCSTTG